MWILLYINNIFIKPFGCFISRIKCIQGKKKRFSYEAKLIVGNIKKKSELCHRTDAKCNQFYLDLTNRSPIRQTKIILKVLDSLSALAITSCNVIFSKERCVLTWPHPADSDFSFFLFNKLLNFFKNRGRVST